jgi:predicted acyltransferase
MIGQLLGVRRPVGALLGCDLSQPFIKRRCQAGADQSGKHGFFRNVFLSWLPPYRASLAYAIVFIILWLGLMWVLYRRKIFIKV